MPCQQPNKFKKCFEKNFEMLHQQDKIILIKIEIYDFKVSTVRVYLPPYKKHGNDRKSYTVIYGNIKVKESSIEVYGNMQVMKRPYYCMIPCKSYTVP